MSGHGNILRKAFALMEFFLIEYARICSKMVHELGRLHAGRVLELAQRERELAQPVN
jgi:hypothetical protein